MRRCGRFGGVILFFALLASPHSQQSLDGAWHDPSPHSVRFVAVEKNVRLEVLDWGGSGRPLVFLAGGGNTAHVFDEVAPKLATDHHVFGITRRGFGASGFSSSENPLDRLRDDVLAVIDTLSLPRLVLVGHSIAGAEMSAIVATRPDRVAGLIYLEAAYPYAFDNGTGPRMAEFQTNGPRAPNPTDGDLASFRALQLWDAESFGAKEPEAELRQTWEADASGRPRKAHDFPGAQSFMPILANTKAFTQIPVPTLAIFAAPHLPDPWIAKNSNSQIQERARTYFAALDAATERQATALEAAVPTAHVVRLPGAHHIFLSNESDTLHEM